jgi:outer membrane cobalamin receptor
MGYYNETESNIMMNKGLYGIDFCAGYHVNDNVTLKGQIRNVMTDSDNAIVWHDLMSGFAVSVFF